MIILFAPTGALQVPAGSGIPLFQFLLSQTHIVYFTHTHTLRIIFQTIIFIVQYHYVLRWFSATKSWKRLLKIKIQWGCIFTSPEEAENVSRDGFWQVKQHSWLSRVNQLPVLILWISICLKIYLFLGLYILQDIYWREIGFYSISLSKQLDMRSFSLGLRRTLNSRRVEAVGGKVSL